LYIYVFISIFSKKGIKMTQQTDLAVIQAAAVLTYGHPNSNDPTKTPLRTVLEITAEATTGGTSLTEILSAALDLSRRQRWQNR
jgi:hypothetical protein